MSIRTALVRQFGHPRGLGGRVAGWVMGRRRSNVRRNRWVAQILGLAPGDRALEIGFGPGVAIEALARAVPEGRVYGVDPSAVMCRQAAKRNARAIRDSRVVLRQAPVEALPDFGERFDAVVAVNSLGFWPEPATRLKELRGVLRPGGRVAIATQPRSKGATADTARHAAAEVEDLLVQAGFADIRTETLPMKPPCVCVLGIYREGA
jgi:ubiquinone/menaquinone biosynthesis C-methylase UbiE